MFVPQLQPIKFENLKIFIQNRAGPADHGHHSGLIRITRPMNVMFSQTENRREEAWIPVSNFDATDIYIPGMIIWYIIILLIKQETTTDAPNSLTLHVQRHRTMMYATRSSF
jgi:hypothetical protein